MISIQQQKVLKNIYSFGQREGGFWNISPDTGQFLYSLILQEKSKYIVEVGAGNGYSTLWLGLAVQKNKGKMVTFEFFLPKVEMCEKNLQKVGLDEIVDVIPSNASRVIPKLKRGVDFVFLDARKCDYLDQLKLLLPKLKKDALIVADNVSSHAKELESYLHFVRTSSLFSSKFIDLGTGLEVSKLITKT